MNLQINDEKIEVNSQQNALEINVENNDLETNVENIEINVEANPQKINLKLDSPVIHETVYETIYETDLANYVSVNEQMFTTEQKSQARENIEAARDIDALKMPDVSIEFKNNEERDLPTIRLTFKNVTPNFLKFLNDQAIYIHLFRRRNGQVHNKKIWNGDIKRNVKKWIHPMKDYNLNDPACSAWGVRRYEVWNPNIVDEINYSYYPIANHGLVDTEIKITATDLNKGWYEIALKDILSPIVVNVNANSSHQNGGCENKIPTEDWTEVKLMGDKNLSGSKKISCVALKFKLYNPYLGYGEANNYIKLMIGRNRGEFEDLSSEILLPDLKYMVEII